MTCFCLVCPRQDLNLHTSLALLDIPSSFSTMVSIPCTALPIMLPGPQIYRCRSINRSPVLRSGRRYLLRLGLGSGNSMRKKVYAVLFSLETAGNTDKGAWSGLDIPVRSTLQSTLRRDSPILRRRRFRCLIFILF